MLDNLEKSLKKAYPNLSDKDATRLITILLESVAEKIAKGEQIASVRTLADGNIDLSILQIGVEPTEMYSDIEIEGLPNKHNAQLTVRFSAPALMKVGDFLEYATESIKAVDFIYALLYFISISDHFVVQDLCKFINQKPEVVALERHKFFDQFDEWVLYPRMPQEGQPQPLRILSMHYGSPLTFDLLGIGNILEVIRDIGKDATWRANHEKLLAKSERELKVTDIEKAKLEIATQKMTLEKISLELALQRVELLERLYKLPLSEQEQMAIASALVPRIVAFVDNKASLSLKAEPSKKVG